MPIEIHNNLVIIPVKLDGQIPLNFILDTGVRPTILLDRSITDSLDVSYARTVGLYGFGKKEEIKALVSEPVKIELEGIKNTGMSVLVLQNNDLRLATHLGIHVHGIIGYDLFSRFVVKIDYFREKLTLIERSEFQLSEKYDSVDIQLIDSKPYLKTDFHLGKSLIADAKFLIDTGASHALIIDSHTSKVEVPTPNIESSLGRGIAGEIRGYLARIDYLEVGDQRLEDVIASFPSTSRPSGDIDRLGSVGGELLRKFTVIFDFLHLKMYLKKNSSFKYPFEYDMSGLEIIAEGNDLDRFVINNVRQKSAAQSVGLKAGDIILSLNNIPSSELELSRIYTSLNAKEGKKVNITVSRNGKYISRTFRLQREI